MALTVNASTLMGAVNGQAAISGTGAALAWNRLDIGSRAGGINRQNGYVQKISVLPNYADSAVQQLSTPP
jgi:hypothetical protein